MGCEECKQRCFNCKFYTEKSTKGLFGSVHKYWVCNNPKTIHKEGKIWWSDGAKIALGEGNIDELLVGANFGCVNWEKSKNEK